MNTDCDCTRCAYAKKHPQTGARRCFEKRIVPLVTDEEEATIRRVCERHGEGQLTIAELLIWTDSVKRGEGQPCERDILAMFMRGSLIPSLNDSDDDDCRGRLHFVLEQS